MKKWYLFLWLISGIFTTAASHPVHVSVINITIEGSMIQLKINTFIDDWETAFFHYHGTSVKLKMSENLEGTWFNDYLASSLVISAGSKENKIKFETDTIFFNDLSMTLEMHAELKEEPDSLYIYNAILTDIFADQTNLLIYSHRDMERGIKFDYHKHEDVVKLK
ncbi:MAG: hypothetical protein K9G38_00910 [Bacteroidales bacterium]|nr:hypothetical protein [Bacteroidales bacterium]